MPSSRANPSWFVAAIQTLIFLARSGEVCSSGMIAEYVQSHPTFLRRVLVQLVKANLVLAHEGREGGYCLACSANDITLANVYQAIKTRDGSFLSPLEATRGPVLEERLRTVLGEVLDETEQDILKVLERHTIAQVAARSELTD